MSLKADIIKELNDFRLDVSFAAEEGITCLFGASGSGKSLTLKCIAGIETPDRGHIELDDRVLFDSRRHISLPPQKRRVGYLFQNYALFPNMTVRENLLCGLHAEKNRAVREQKLRNMIERMRLCGLEAHKPHQLSGGQAQRTALARILLSEPEVLLLDEPFSALDEHLRDSLRIELKEMLETFGKEVLLVTHSREEAFMMSSRIGVIADGKMLTMKTPAELFRDPGGIEAASLTGCKNIAAAEKRASHELLVPDWGICLHTKKEIRDGLLAVGVHLHHIHPAIQENRNKIRLLDRIEGPTEAIVQFRFENQYLESEPLFFSFPREENLSDSVSEVGIAPESVLLLYE